MSADELAEIGGHKPKVLLKDGEETQVSSMSSSGSYKVKRTFDHYYCVCPAWRNQGGVPTNARTCKHLCQLLGEDYEVARVTEKNPHGTLPTFLTKGKGKAAKPKSKSKAPASKAKPSSSRGKRKRDEDDEDEESEDEKPKSKAKGKGKKKKDDSSDEEEDRPKKKAKKKRKASSDEESEDEEPKKKSKKRKADTEDSEDEKPKKAKKKRKASSDEDESEDEKPKQKAKKKRKAESSDEDESEDEKPKKKAKKKRKAESDSDESDEEEKSPKKKAKKPASKRRKADDSDDEAPKKKPASKSKPRSKRAKDDDDDDSDGATNWVGKSGPPEVLLANKWDIETGPDPTGWHISEKLDGVRTFYNGKGMVSRLGNPFTPPQWFLDKLPKDVTLDGELFAGRGKFSDTVSIVKTINSPHWKNIKFHIFDIPSESTVFEDRIAKLEKLFGLNGKFACSEVVIVEHEKAKSRKHVLDKLAEVEAMGGEGLMLRKPGSRYEGRRSSTLLKIKTFYDAEAIVTGYTDGKGKHAGMTGALICKMECGKNFNVGSGLTDKDRRSPPKIGSIIVYRFQEITQSGVPRFPSYQGVAIDKKKPKDADIPAHRKGKQSED